MRNRHERDAVGVEELDHFREVGEGTGQAVDFVNHHYIDEVFADVGQQPLQSRAFHGGARAPAIIIGGLDQPPALARLALDERFARVALRLQRIKVLLQAFFGRLASDLPVPNVERVLKEMAAIAMVDAAQCFDTDGNLLPLHKMDEITRCAVVGFELTEGATLKR